MFSLYNLTCFFFNFFGSKDASLKPHMLGGEKEMCDVYEFLLKFVISAEIKENKT